MSADQSLQGFPLHTPSVLPKATSCRPPLSSDVMAHPPPAGYQPARGVRDRTERDGECSFRVDTHAYLPRFSHHVSHSVMDTQDRVREEVRRDYDQQPGQHFYVDNEVVLSCWSEIWRWLNVSSSSL